MPAAKDVTTLRASCVSHEYTSRLFIPLRRYRGRAGRLLIFNATRGRAVIRGEKSQKMICNDDTVIIVLIRPGVRETI